MGRVAAIGLAILLLASAAGAANNQTFTDPVGDSQPGAPDISSIQVANDDNGRFEIRVTLANRPELLEGDFVSFYLDRDDNTATGCGQGVGVDYALNARGHDAPTPDTFGILRCLNSVLDVRTPQTGFSGMYDPATQTVTFDLSCANIGRPSSFRLVVVTNHGPTAFDFAGDDQPWIYTVTPRCPPDTQAPHVRTLASTGVRGGTAKLRYHVSDDSGETQEKIAVYQGKRGLARTTTSWGSAAPGPVYFVSWPVPKHAQHSLRFCVRAKDRAGNGSKLSCARLTIR